VRIIHRCALYPRFYANIGNAAKHQRFHTHSTLHPIYLFYDRFFSPDASAVTRFSGWTKWEKTGIQEMVRKGRR